MIGTKLAHYEITAHLGSGGMGEVYQATDLKLKRSVAIKFLPDTFAADLEHLSRFRHEAQILASLNHPNIAHIYGLEESAEKRCIVMELVEGETLQARLQKGPIPVGEALIIAKQVAEALETAHEKGVIHRDLKPGNVMLARDGRVKVLDFGLAKAYGKDSSDASLSNSPTMASMAATGAGVILGTAAYMSPEQAKGRTVDKRTDIFAFGCLFYEMLTGRAAFEGEDVTDILGAVLRMEPDWMRLPEVLPTGLRNMLRLCLEKNVKDRRSCAADLRIDIEMALEHPETITPLRESRIGWIVAVVMALVSASLTAVYFGQKTTTPPQMRVDITTPSTADPLDFALSPNGQQIAFVASGDGSQRLWVRTLDKTESRAIPGTESAESPFWSPDGRSIGFFVKGSLKRVDIAGGPPQALANAPGDRGGAWNSDGTIVFAPELASALFRVAASGGEAVPVTTLNRQTSHRFPQFLPDGRHFLFYAQGSPETQGIYVASLDGGEPKLLTRADTAAVYLAPEMIAFMRQTALMAQHIDLKRLELTGEPILIADSVGSNNNSSGAFSASADGQLAYRSGIGALRQLVWCDRSGKAVGAVGEPDPSNLLYPALSPDGQHLAVSRTVQNTSGPNTDIWLFDLNVKGSMAPLTLDRSNDHDPVWSPDGKQIAFSSNRKGAFNLYLKPSSGATSEELLLETPNSKDPADWSNDGRYLLYVETDPKSARNLLALPLTGPDRKPIAIANTPFDEINGQFSPDGRWVAYETNETGRAEVVVQAFPSPTNKWRVSTNGGEQPRWRADGKELYFIAMDGRMMAAPVTESGTTFVGSTPVALFPARLAYNNLKQQYAVSRDGRFLLNQQTESSSNTPITLILNWKPPSK